MEASRKGPRWGEDTSDPEALLSRSLVAELWPSFEIVREYEWIRQSGKFNMITEFGKVVEEMYRLGFINAIVWLQDCKEQKVFFGSIMGDAIRYYRSQMSNDKEWFDAGFLKQIKSKEIKETKDKLAELRKQLKKLKNSQE